MSGIPFPQKVWTGAHEWTTLSSSVHAGGTRSPASQPVGVPTPRPPPPPVFKGSSEALLYPFGPASHFACDKFIYTCVWPLPRLSTGFTTSHLLSLLFAPLPCRPPSTPQGKHKGFPLPWGLCDTEIRPPLQRRLLWAAMMQNTSAVPFGREAAWASRVSPSWEALNPSQHFPSDCWKPQRWPPCLREGPTGGAARATERHPRGAGRLPPPPGRVLLSRARLIFSLASSWERCLQSHAREPLCQLYFWRL